MGGYKSVPLWLARMSGHYGVTPTYLSGSVAAGLADSHERDHDVSAVGNGEGLDGG